MTKLRTLVGAAAIFLVGSTTSLMAMSFGGGVTGGAAYLEVSGTETLHVGNTSTAGRATKATEGGAGVMPSVFIQAQAWGGWTLGAERVLGEVTLEGKREVNQDKGPFGTITMTTNLTEVTFKDLTTYYVETPGITPLGVYLKAGYSEMNIDTDEELGTGGAYPDKSVDATTLGFGFKKGDPEGGWQVKTEFTYTEWGELTFTSTEDSQGDNVVKASPNVGAVKFSFGYNF